MEASVGRKVASARSKSPRAYCASCLLRAVDGTSDTGKLRTAMKKRPVLYLPIETKGRELLGKTFLAARAVERDWIVVTGHIGETRRFMKENVPGVFVEISIPESKAERLERLHRLGHRIVNLCEEAIIYSDGRDYCARKIGAGTFPWVELLLLPGK